MSTSWRPAERLLAALSLIVLFALGMAMYGQANQPPPASDDDYIENVLYPATALLFEQDDKGSMRMLCTATAIEKTANGYRFLTAAHCVAEDNENRKEVEPKKGFLFISGDAPGSKEFLRAKLVAAGYQHRGDDFSLLDVETKAEFPVVKLGFDPTGHAAESIVNIASPLGLGKQTFRGYVSSPLLDRPVAFSDIQWTGAMLIQLYGTNGGSSGSAIVCMKQRAICGNLVGSVGQTETVAVPISRFKKFYEMFKAGKYKWFRPEE